VATQLERLERFLQPIFVRRYESPRERLRDLEQLAALASQARSREAFLTGLALDPPVSTSDLAGPPLLDEDYLILSTIHSAKGLEWEVVHLLHVADGMIPSDMATGRPEEVEEERRLLYVAMTRARQALHLYFPLKVYHRPRGVSDRHFYGQVSRFLPDEVLEAFDRRVSPAAQQPPPEPPGDGPGTRREVDAFLAGLWG
jgi:DNA helicase-2/ATP-dependent DNA helicase PcrA